MWPFKGNKPTLEDVMRDLLRREAEQAKHNRKLERELKILRSRIDEIGSRALPDWRTK